MFVTPFLRTYVVNVWNKLSANIDFSSVKRFRRSVVSVDFSNFYNNFKSILFCVLCAIWLYCNVSI